MAIVRIYTAPNGESHFRDVERTYELSGDQSDLAELIGVVWTKLAALTEGARLASAQSWRTR